MKRTDLRPKSAKKAKADRLKPPIRAALYKRDGGCVLAGAELVHDRVPPCFGGPTPHHMRKEKHGGDYNLANLVTLCAGHNDWVETEPILSWKLGLVCRSGEILDECWRKMRAAGLVAW